MLKEHCVSYGCDKTFVTSNYGVKTTPKFEWTLIVEGENKIKTLMHKQPYHDEAIKVNKEHGRVLPDIALLLEDPRSKSVGLKKPEIIAIVLYTGPMVFLVFHEELLSPYSLCQINSCDMPVPDFQYDSASLSGGSLRDVFPE